jgi:hypothetical protein
MSNDQQKMTKQPKNDRQSITQKIKDLETWTPLKTGGGISLPINKSMINIPESNVGDTSLISERLKSYPRVSEISLSCTFCRCLILFLTFNSCFSFVFVCKLHVNNVSYFPFMSIKKEIPYFCVLCEDYYVIIWLIVRMCVFIKDWKLIYSELFILKRKSMENWGGGSWHKLYSMHLPVKHTCFFVLHQCKLRKSHIANNRNWSVSKVRIGISIPTYDNNWNIKYVSNYAISTFEFLYDEKARLTRRVPLVELELLTILEHLNSPVVFSGVHVTRSLVLSVMLQWLFVLLSLFFWPLCCLSFFDLRILITPVVPSSYSYGITVWNIVN